MKTWRSDEIRDGNRSTMSLEASFKPFSAYEVHMVGFLILGRALASGSPNFGRSVLVGIEADFCN